MTRVFGGDVRHHLTRRVSGFYTPVGPIVFVTCLSIIEIDLLSFHTPLGVPVFVTWKSSAATAARSVFYAPFGVPVFL